MVDDGGPAFPNYISAGGGGGGSGGKEGGAGGGGAPGILISGGMSLRDYFAAAAISRCIEVAAEFVMLEPGFEPNTRKLSEIMLRASKAAFHVADDMLAERSKP